MVGAFPSVYWLPTNERRRSAGVLSTVFEGRRDRLVYDALGEEARSNVERLLDGFRSHFCPTALDHVLDAESVFTRVQRPTERVRDYVSAVQKLARRLPALNEGILKCIILRGLRSNINAFVLQQCVDSISDIMEAARIAETSGMAGSSATAGEMSELMDEVWASSAEVR